MSIAKSCKVSNCNRKYYAKNYCNFHWQRQHKGIDFSIPYGHKHGYHQHYLYSTWESMKQRCLNPANKHYSSYGGRGIDIHPEWLEAVNFIKYVEANIGNRPTNSHSLDRIDNDKGYYPGNIRWATKSEQVRNQRVRRDNLTGYRGVSWDNMRNKWVARLTIDGKYKYLGRFENKDDAKKAVNRAGAVSHSQRA